MTTAASLWVVSAIGLAAGAGFYFSALLVTGLVFIALERSLETYLFRNSRRFKVVTLNGTSKVKEINRILESHGIISQNISMTLLKEEEQNRTIIEYKLRTPFHHINVDKILVDINEVDGVYSAEQE